MRAQSDVALQFAKRAKTSQCLHCLKLQHLTRNVLALRAASRKFPFDLSQMYTRPATKPAIRTVCSIPVTVFYNMSQKNAPTLENMGLICIIFGQQHLHTFRNDMLIQLSLYLHFYLLYLLLNSCDGNDANQRVFLGICWWL